MECQFLAKIGTQLKAEILNLACDGGYKWNRGGGFVYNMGRHFTRSYITL
jgi:hypothetical protein